MMASAPSTATLTAMPTKKPTGWIILSCVLALAAVGLGVWAFSAQSDADDAQAKLESAEQAVQAATPAPTTAPESTPAPAPEATPDPAVQEQFDQIAADLGATNASVEQIQQDLEAAAAKVSDAAQAKEDASGALDTARAEIEEAQARFELTKTCMLGTVDALGAAFETGGLNAAVEELQTLATNCTT